MNWHVPTDTVGIGRTSRAGKHAAGNSALGISARPAHSSEGRCGATLCSSHAAHSRDLDLLGPPLLHDLVADCGSALKGPSSYVHASVTSPLQRRKQGTKR